MNKRDLMLGFLDPQYKSPYIPAAFFLHFDPHFHRGQPAIDKHLEFFRYTGMDFVKIQYELAFPTQPEIQKPDDWANLQLPDDDFYQDQWDLAAGLVQAAGKDALVLMTLYSPFMCAGQIADKDRVLAHLQQDPESFKKGIQRITDSLLAFVRGCIQRGIDGFYHSTQGAETFRLGGSPWFDACIKPYDLALMQEINQTSRFNILHICDYHGGYSDLSPFLDYPGDVVNCSLAVGDKTLTPTEVAEMFGRPFMGGLERKGALAHGSLGEIRAAVESALSAASPQFILGADCTVPGKTSWDNLRAAIGDAHHVTRA